MAKSPFEPSPDRIRITYTPVPPREPNLPPADELPEGWTTVTALKAEIAGKPQPSPEEVSRRIDEYVAAHRDTVLGMIEDENLRVFVARLDCSG